MSTFEGFVDGVGVEGRICYIRAWDDPQWCAKNGLPSPAERRSASAKRGAAKRAARRLQADRGGG